MAGRGSRTADLFSEPKPLIPVLGAPLVAWALSGLPLAESTEVILIINPEVANVKDLHSLVLPFLPQGVNLSVQIVLEPTSGQAETVLVGTKHLDDDEPVLIFNCDTVISDNFPKHYRELDGILGTFDSVDPQMSYVESQNEKVVRTAEKIVISNEASTGLYYFKSLGVFRRAYSETSHINESYVAPLYNNLIKRGLKVESYSTDVVIPLGTSAQILDFINCPQMYLMPKRYR